MGNQGQTEEEALSGGPNSEAAKKYLEDQERSLYIFSTYRGGTWEKLEDGMVIMRDATTPEIPPTPNNPVPTPTPEQPVSTPAPTRRLSPAFLRLVIFRGFLLPCSEQGWRQHGLGTDSEEEAHWRARQPE